jgi:hypothetical protein
MLLVQIFVCHLYDIKKAQLFWAFLLFTAFCLTIQFLRLQQQLLRLLRVQGYR